MNDPKTDSLRWSKYLSPTPIIDSDHPRIAAFARKTAQGAGDDPVARAVRCYYAVRDGLRYNPYLPFFKPEHYRTSRVLQSGTGFCITKAALLCACGRVLEIPSRLGFATVRNHLATRQLIEHLGTDLFVFHGYTEFHLNGRWVKATPAFNKELCEHFGVPPLEFNGLEDSVFHAFNSSRQPFMEYVEYYGEFADVPVSRILEAWRKYYGEKRIQAWMDQTAPGPDGGNGGRDFYKEEIYRGCP